MVAGGEDDVVAVGGPLGEVGAGAADRLGRRDEDGVDGAPIAGYGANASNAVVALGCAEVDG